MDEQLPTVICAWCGKVVTAAGEALTHGICEPCAAELMAVIEKQAKSGGGRPRPDPGALGDAPTPEGKA